MALNDELMDYDYATKTRHFEHDPTSLCNILDKLQENIEQAKTPAEVQTLKGSYGVYLHHLRHCDQHTAAYYIEWMKEYNKAGQ